MKTRKLGSQGLTSSTLGLGCMGMSAFYGKRDDMESLATIHFALDQGVTMLDTADMYGPHTNEELVGKAIRGHRDQVVLATKFGFIFTDPKDPTKRGLSGKPDYVKSACDASLKRLGVDVIDLYYQHRVDPKTPIEETVGAMADLVRLGKVRYLGLSEPSAKTLRRAHAVHPISAVQSEYSLWTREPEQDGVLQTCRELGIGFVSYSPLGRGFLTGEIKNPDDFDQDDYRRFQPRFLGENFKKNLNLVEAIKTMAKKKGCTPAQLAIGWVLAKGDDVFPIPGTKSRKRMEENLGALQVQFSGAEFKEIDDVFQPGRAAGTRYPESMMGLLGG